MKILELLILVCLGTAFLIGMTSLLGVILMNGIANELSKNQTPKIVTLYQMQILLEEATKDIFDFSRLEEPPQKQDFQAATNDFEMNAHELRRLASTGNENKELVLLLDDSLAKQFSYFKYLGERLIDVQGNQSDRIIERRNLLIQQLDPIIDDRLQKNLSPSDSLYPQKQEALLEMEINMHELFAASSGYIVKPDSSLKHRIDSSIDDFQYWFERFVALNAYSFDNTTNISTSSIPATATAEAAGAPTIPTAHASFSPPLLLVQQMQNRDQTVQDLISIKSSFDRVSRLTQYIIELEDTEQNQLADLTRVEAELEDILDNEIKPIILQEIQGLENSAEDMVTIALVSIVIAILSAIILGIIISSQIVKPIKRLRQAVNEVEAGNLNAQVVGIGNGGRKGAGKPVAGGVGDGTSARGRSDKDSSIIRRSTFASEELTDLSQSFNSMTEKLKANNMMQKEFLGIASHELRSPIQPILSYADLANKGDVPYEQAMEKILTNALKLQSLANDILDVARIEAGQFNCVMKPVSVNRVVKDAVDSIRENFRKDVNLEVQLLEHDVDIKLDPDRIGQVLTNVLGNAAKFTEKGKIRIETGLASDDNSLIEIRISDTGGGIPEEILPRLFEKFATKDAGASAKQGTGLGLYISKAIVKAHNGKISAFNNPEGGSTFVISLPIEQEG
jgi:signal transduction histidine kinase